MGNKKVTQLETLHSIIHRGIHKTKLKVAAYARVSTEMENQLNSLEVQKIIMKTI